MSHHVFSSSTTAIRGPHTNVRLTNHTRSPLAGTLPARPHGSSTKHVCARINPLSVCKALSSPGSLPDDQADDSFLNIVRAMEPASVADTLWAMLLSRGADQEDFAAVATVMGEDISRFSPSALVSILSATAESGYQDQALLVLISEELCKAESMAVLSSSELTTLAWSLAMLNVAAQDLLEAVAQRASQLILDFTPSDLARLLGGFGELRNHNSELLEAASTRLRVSLIPMAQMSCDELAKVVFAYARLEAYDQGLFDAAAKEITRTAQDASPQAASQVAWAYSQVRELDTQHRVVRDKPLLYILAEVMQGHIEQARRPTSPQHPELLAASLPVKSLLTFLLSYANLSHHVAKLFSDGGELLATRISHCSPQDLVMASYAYTRVKHSSPTLMKAVGDAAIKVLPELDNEDCVYLALAAAQTYHEGLMHSVLTRVLLATESGTQVEATTLLDLARVVASVQHQDTEYYGPVLDKLLHHVKTSHGYRSVEVV